MSECCNNVIESLYTANIISSDGRNYVYEVENPTIDPSIVSYEGRTNSRSISKQRKRSSMSVTLTSVRELSEDFIEGGTIIRPNNVFEPIIAKCGLTIVLVSECGSQTIVMTDATEESQSSIVLSEGTFDAVFTSPNRIQMNSLNESVSNIFEAP